MYLLWILKGGVFDLNSFKMQAVKILQDELLNFSTFLQPMVSTFLRYLCLNSDIKTWKPEAVLSLQVRS